MRLAALASAALLLSAAPLSAALKPGSKAPDFATEAARAGKAFPLRLSDALKKGPVVLYFFPAAFTPGCTVEAHAFAEATDAFRKAGAAVIGMSADGIEPLRRFSTEACRDRFAVASATPAIIRGYDVVLPRTIRAAEGSPRVLSNRTSYVIDRNGRIAFAYSDPNPAEHVTRTLAAVRALKAR